jgi:hypothetical protein
VNKTGYIIHVRSRIHKVFYRKIEIIEDYEFVILSLIDRAGGSIKFDELGVLLGFATKDIVDRNIRVDNAEAYLLDLFLNSLIKYKLIEKDNGLVNNLFWGGIALEKKEKYKFFSAEISLPDFFDFRINEKEFFNFENLGFDLKFKYERESTDNEFVEQGVDFQEEYDNILKNEFWNSSKLDKKIFSIDYIEDKPISFERNDITTEAYINVVNNELSVFYEDINQEKLIDVLNYEQNKNSLSDITLKCIYANFLGSTETINSNNITPFLNIVNWEQIIIDNRVVWEVKFVDLILPNSNQLLSNQTSENCELAFLESNLEKYTNLWDWAVVTKRVDLHFILENLSIYPWDISYLIKELEESELEKNLNEIIKIIGNSQDDIAILIPRISNEFLLKNIKSITLDLNLFLYDKRDDFDQIVYSYLEYKWDWYYVISNVNLQIFIDNLNIVYGYIQPEINHFLNTILDLKNQGSLVYTYDLIKDIVVDVNLDSFSKYNSQSSIVSDINILRLLNSSNLIYWGDNSFQGFEKNKNIEWDIIQLKEFVKFFNYQESIDFLSSTISSNLVIDEFNNLKWNWEIISENSKLISIDDFIEQQKSQLKFLQVAEYINVDILFDKYELIKSNISNEDNEVFSNIISKRFSLVQILEKEKLNIGDLIINDWSSIFEKVSNEVLLSIVKEYHVTVPRLHNSIEFSKLITKEFSLTDIFNNIDFYWDWHYITQLLLKEGLNDNIIEKYADKLYWPLIIDEHYTEEDILLRNKLPIISTLVNSSNDYIHLTWEAITTKYPLYDFNNAIESTFSDDQYKWNWDVISSTEKIDTKLDSLEKYKEKIDWELLSSNQILNEIFNLLNKDLFSDFESWINKVNTYLITFENLWKFKKLSNISSINWQQSIIENFISKWDWEVLSSESSRLLSEKDKDSNEKNVFRYSEYKLDKFADFINWHIISNRRDLEISEQFVIKHVKKDWDWGELSRNPMFTPSLDFLIEYSDKKWNWNNFSKAGWLTSDYIKKLADKDWDWENISKNRNFSFDIDLLKILNLKENVNWNEIVNSPNIKFDIETLKILTNNNINNFWNIISKSSRLVIDDDLLSRYRLNWDWDLLIEYNIIDVNNVKLLESYESSLSWDAISKSPTFKPSSEVLSIFKDKLNWRYISKKLDITIFVLRQFKNYLDWEIISSNSRIEFNKNLVSEFLDVLDLNRLSSNPSLDKKANDLIQSFLAVNDNARFIYNLKAQHSTWRGSIYHFTHITNAVNAINSMKILSRNKVKELEFTFSDAAGNVISLRDASHDYARFYFRPQTPTQFYNECLGKDCSSGRMGWTKNNGEWIKEWKLEFPKAKNLGLPKCPIPVFFKFDIKEVIDNYSELCEISDGNMQKSNTMKGAISLMHNRFSFEDLYSTIDSTSDRNWKTYLDKSQQEFLVKDELDFSKLKNVEIIVRTKEDKDQLIGLIDSNMESIIRVDYNRECFHNNNRAIDYKINENEFHIQSNYQGDGNQSGEFWVESESDYEIVSGKENVLYKEDKKLVFYPEIELSFSGNTCFTAYFKDKVTNKPEWEVVKYCDNESYSETNTIQNLKAVTQQESKKTLSGIKKMNNEQDEILIIWEEIIQINYVLNTYLTFNELSKLLDNQEYNPFKIYEKIKNNHFAYDPELIIDPLKIEYFICSNIKIESLKPLLSFTNLKCVWAYNCMTYSKFINIERPRIEKNILATVFGDMDEDTVLTNNDKYFSLYFNLKIIFDHYPHTYSSKSLLNILMRYEILNDAYRSHVRHYKLFDHTLIVLNQYQKYFAGTDQIINMSQVEFNYKSDDWFKTLLALHDIGKPEAFKHGNKDNQYIHTLEIIHKISHAFPFNHLINMKIYDNLLSNDILGEYFQGRKSLTYVINSYKDLNDISTPILFKTQMIYYQCDVAAYTADAGGLKFLEHLFEYKNGEKIFDEEEGLIRFSPKYWKMYLELKKEIELCQ